MNRPEPVDCRHEPPYPAHQTVLMSLAAPDIVVHNDQGGRCRQEGPHPWKDCDHVQGACWDCGEVPTDEEDRRAVKLGFNCRPCFDRDTVELEQLLNLPQGAKHLPPLFLVPERSDIIK